MPKEVGTLAGYMDKREENYEIKYLRKVLGKVDTRIKVPDSVSADSLRALLDNVEAPAPREAATRRPGWLSLQSGIAYAAAFVLIVALFYSTRLYRPDVISGGMDIVEESQAVGQAVEAKAPDDAGDLLLAPNEDSGSSATMPDVPNAAAGNAAIAPFAETVSEQAPETSGGERADVSHKLGVGGGGESTFIFEQDGYAYYQRTNDVNDPDRTSPVSLEVVNIETQEIAAQSDIPLSEVSRNFEINGEIVFVGAGLSGETVLYIYDVSTPEEPVFENAFSQEGVLVGARAYNGIIHIVSIAGAGDSDAELLPNCASGEVCVITAFDPVTQESVTKRFVGANGTVQLHNLSAYIRYTGVDEAGDNRDYIAQIALDGMDIELGTVSQ